MLLTYSKNVNKSPNYIILLAINKPPPAITDTFIKVVNKVSPEWKFPIFK